MFFSEEEKRLLMRAVKARITKFGEEGNRPETREGLRQASEEVDDLTMLFLKIRGQD